LDGAELVIEEESPAPFALTVEEIDGESISTCAKAAAGELCTEAVFSTDPSNFMVVRHDDK
jgi:hypothetical protein